MIVNPFIWPHRAKRRGLFVRGVAPGLSAPLSSNSVAVRLHRRMVEAVKPPGPRVVSQHGLRNLRCLTKLLWRRRLRRLLQLTSRSEFSGAAAARPATGVGEWTGFKVSLSLLSEPCEAGCRKDYESCTWSREWSAVYSAKAGRKHFRIRTQKGLRRPFLSDWAARPEGTLRGYSCRARESRV